MIHSDKTRSISGVMVTSIKASIVIYFETSPIWLMGFTPSMGITFYFPEVTSFSTLAKFLPSHLMDLYNRIILWFGRRSFIFGTLPSSHDLVLVSGSIGFIESIFTLFSSSTTLGIYETYGRFRKLPQSNLTIQRVKHHDFGGVTNFENLIFSTERWIFSKSILTRLLNDFISSSIRPTVWKQPPRFIVQSQLLPIQNYHVPVEVTWGKHTGYRSLTNTELSAIFGFPRNFESLVSPTVLDSFVPIQILDGLLDHWKQRHQMNTSTSSPSVPMRYCPPAKPDPPLVVFPGISGALPPDWRLNLPVSQESTKNDNAAVPIHHWNLRIIPLFLTHGPTPGTFLPHQLHNATSSKPPLDPHTALDKIRHFVLRWYFRRFYLEFLSYVKSNYAFHWGNYLLGARYHDTSKGGCFFLSDYKFHPKAHPNEIYFVSSLPQNHWKLHPKNDPRVNKDFEFCWMLHQSREIIYKILNSSYFAWDAGSTLIFWRWPRGAQEFARDGEPPFPYGNPPTFNRRPRPLEKTHKPLAWEKLSKYLRRNYLHIVPSHRVRSYINYFLVPKGPTDVRFVLSATNCGLNPSCWVPSFWMPTANSMLRVLHYGSKVIDIDLGEMFLNFMIGRILMLYSGVDLTQFRREIEKEFPEWKGKLGKRIAAIFSRSFFGFTQSPITAARSYYLSEEFARGDPRDPNNKLKWDEVILNLIGDLEFNPAMPSVYKWDSVLMQIAADILAFVDDCRTAGMTYEEAWAAARQIASRLQYLGIQDAGRKRRLDNGPWAGGVYDTSHGQVVKTVTQKKWEKGKNYLKEIRNLMKTSETGMLNYKLLERIRGFFCHLAMVFEIFSPYLKGFHLTLASHLPKRDDGGWKLTDTEWYGYVQAKLESGTITDKQAEELNHVHEKEMPSSPEEIKPVENFEQSLMALERFMETETPPRVVVRQAKATLLIYGFVDASGSGFGGSKLYKNNIHYRVGVWSTKDSNESSNWREFENLVEDFEESGRDGWLEGNYVIMATDNDTVEKVIYKGNSSDEKLFGLVLRLKTAELKYSCKLVVSHVSGLRMIAQGTDGVSRGNLKEGVNQGIDMFAFFPWNKSAFQAQPLLKPWVENWIQKETHFLSPKDWYVRGHDIIGYEKNKTGFSIPIIEHGWYVWAPPPAAADVALEELRKARIKRTISTHVIIIPKLMTPLWLRQIHKVADVIIEVPPIHNFWQATNYETLTIAFVFPMLSYRPFQLRKTPKMLELGRSMSKVFKEKDVASRTILREFRHQIRNIYSMPRDLVWNLLYFGGDTPFPRSIGGGTDGNLEERSES